MRREVRICEFFRLALERIVRKHFGVERATWQLAHTAWPLLKG